MIDTLRVLVESRPLKEGKTGSRKSLTPQKREDSRIMGIVPDKIGRSPDKLKDFIENKRKMEPGKELLCFRNIN